MKIKTILTVALLALAPGVYSTVVLADTKACPPGLAKKNPPCVPPGQAKKGVTTEDWQQRHRIGDTVQQGDITFLDEYRRYNLPRLPVGQRYAVVDGNIVIIEAETYRILQLIRAFTALAN